MPACLILVKYPAGQVMCFTFHFGYRNYGFQVFLTVEKRQNEKNVYNGNTVNGEKTDSSINLM